jgi:DNA-binding NtrC family response regulator
MRRANNELSSRTLSSNELSWRRLSSGTVRRRRLLVVDPDAVYRIGLEEPLEATLWSSIGWADAADALEWLAENPDALVDALWCEHELRDGPAATFVERVRGLRPGLPALVVMATPRDAEARRAYPDGVHFFAKKETAEAVRLLAGIADQPRERIEEPLRREA